MGSTSGMRDTHTHPFLSPSLFPRPQTRLPCLGGEGTRDRLTWVRFTEEMREATPATRREVGACLQPALGKPVVLQPLLEPAKPAGTVAGAGIPGGNVPSWGPGGIYLGAVACLCVPALTALAEAVPILLVEAVPVLRAPCCLGDGQGARRGVHGGGGGHKSFYPTSFFSRPFFLWQCLSQGPFPPGMLDLTAGCWKHLRERLSPHFSSRGRGERRWH